MRFCVQEAATPKCSNSTEPDPDWIPMSYPHSHGSILEATCVEYKQFYTYQICLDKHNVKGYAQIKND